MADRMAYVAIKECGCFVAGTVDEPRFAAETRRSVAEWERRGYQVIREPVENAKQREWVKRGGWCSHDPSHPALAAVSSGREDTE